MATQPQSQNFDTAPQNTPQTRALQLAVAPEQMLPQDFEAVPQRGGNSEGQAIRHFTKRRSVQDGSEHKAWLNLPAIDVLGADTVGNFAPGEAWWIDTETDDDGNLFLYDGNGDPWWYDPQVNTCYRTYLIENETLALFQSRPNSNPTPLLPHFEDAFKRAVKAGIDPNALAALVPIPAEINDEDASSNEGVHIGTDDIIATEVVRAFRLVVLEQPYSLSLQGEHAIGERVLLTGDPELQKRAIYDQLGRAII